jgi:hypothetical protein
VIKCLLCHGLVSRKSGACPLTEDTADEGDELLDGCPEKLDEDSVTPTTGIRWKLMKVTDKDDINPKRPCPGPSLQRVICPLQYMLKDERRICAIP